MGGHGVDQSLGSKVFRSDAHRVCKGCEAATKLCEQGGAQLLPDGLPGIGGNCHAAHADGMVHLLHTLQTLQQACTLWEGSVGMRSY